MSKRINMRHDFAQAIRNIHSHGIMVHGSFILGYDVDTSETFQELVDFIDETNILMPIINILTPFPGTKLFKRLMDEGRVLHTDWNKYDTKSVVYKPVHLSEQELLDGFHDVIRAVYSFDSIYRKLRHFWDIDFFKRSNEKDPIRFKYRALFAIRLTTMLFSFNFKRSGFILKMLPRVFDKRVRVSTILSLMAYNDYACS
jgi:radical SAM superfamily enzyme YgiQ (UPF0313 family)